MVEKKGFAVVATATIVLYLLVQVDTSVFFIVGDGKGWQRDVASWPDGKVFRAGDILLFKYERGTHTVGIVNGEEGFKNCDPSSILREFKSGYDQYELVHGANYFMCGIKDDCLANMKMKVVTIN